jgi:hypothetical protein
LSFEDLDSTSSSCRCTVVTSPHRILSLFFSFSSHFAATIYHLPAGKIPHGTGCTDEGDDDDASEETAAKAPADDSQKPEKTVNASNVAKESGVSTLQHQTTAVGDAGEEEVYPVFVSPLSCLIFVLGVQIRETHVMGLANSEFCPVNVIV